MTRSKWTIARVLLAGLVLAHAAAANVFATLPARHTSTIFVADAQGGQGVVVDGLNQIIQVSRMPLRVEQVYWSTLNLPADFQNQYNFAVKGNQLAARVLAVRNACPDGKIYLVGFGAGTTVVLKACDWLPAKSVTRVVLIAPTVTCSYDLRRALNASVEGIDVFYSRQDTELETAIAMFGPTDIGKRSKTGASGIYGFVPIIRCSADAQLYKMLRQHNQKNFGSLSPLPDDNSYRNPMFLQTEIVPLLRSALYTPRPSPQSCPLPTPAPKSQTPPPAPKTPTPPPPAPKTPTPPPPAPQQPYPPPPAPHVPEPTPPPPVPGSTNAPPVITDYPAPPPPTPAPVGPAPAPGSSGPQGGFSPQYLPFPTIPAQPGSAAAAPRYSIRGW